MTNVRDEYDDIVHTRIDRLQPPQTWCGMIFLDQNTAWRNYYTLTSQAPTCLRCAAVSP